jgi:para-aminobenzoate synthetase/4-amino-4-deoxychorismate lyase
MTSTVTAQTRAGLVEIMQALFPCGSITGAPKLRAMQLIAELESSPRGVYTGALGYLAPDGAMRFSVAIRCAQLIRERALYGVGGGIVWDSEPSAEWQECRLKTAVLGSSAGVF